MTPDQTITQGDLLPAFAAQLQNADGSIPDLTNATMQCRVQLADRSRQASVTVPAILDARGGFVQHAWVAAEVNVPGLLLVDFVRTDVGPETWPKGRSYTVRVLPKLSPP